MTIEAHAKINWTLEVGPRRPDGYHSLRSIVLPIALHDTLEFVARPGAITTNTGYGDKDLIIKAAKALNITEGYEIRVTKNIPAGGGLGGGSADAAATLKTLNSLNNLNLPISALMEIGATVGSDVPALVYGAPCLMSGRGEVIEPLPREADIPVRALQGNGLEFCFPGFACDTAAVYAECTPRTEFSSSTEPHNDLTAPALKLYPELKQYIDDGWHLSGSGSTLFKPVP